MRITVEEQSPIQIRPREDEEKRCFNPAQALALMDLGERMGARIASWQNPRSLRTHQFVGVARVGDLQVEILPKLDGLPVPAQVRQSLLAMLAVTQDLEVSASEVAGFLEGSEPFLCALARLYCRRLLEAVRRGLRQEYVLHQDLLSHLRGKVDWPAQAKLQVSQRLEFNCVFDDRSEDTALNRTLKGALLRAGAMLESARIANLVTELRHALDGVSDQLPPVEQVARLRTDRMNHHLAPLLALAKLILGNRNPDLGRAAQGDRHTYALVWDMNTLFEEYIGRLAQKAWSSTNILVELQDRAAVYLAQEVSKRQNAFLLRPDILVRRSGHPCLVADSKWKRLDPHRRHLGVSEADVYQILAYAHRYGTEQALLLYPHHPALGAPGGKREFQVQGASRPVRVRIVTLDLAHLKSIPEQLAQLLRAEDSASATLEGGLEKSSI